MVNSGQYRFSTVPRSTAAPANATALYFLSVTVAGAEAEAVVAEPVSIRRLNRAPIVSISDADVAGRERDHSDHPRRDALGLTVAAAFGIAVAGAWGYRLGHHAGRRDYAVQSLAAAFQLGPLPRRNVGRRAISSLSGRSPRLRSPPL
jgi:hypothetical protein